MRAEESKIKYIAAMWIREAQWISSAPPGITYYGYIRLHSSSSLKKSPIFNIKTYRADDNKENKNSSIPDHKIIF